MELLKGIIYYTDNLIEEPILSAVRQRISDSGLPIVSTSLKPIDFGRNIVVEGERGYVTMVRQIYTALENLETRYVFFCEHDVLYPQSHFDFTPSKDGVFYYNDNVWRWYYGTDKAITYDRLISLSSLCCNRQLALKNYELRTKMIEKYPSEFDSREPSLARKWGYEPGTKKKKRGGLTDEDFETWKSKDPIIDIRHPKTFSPPKMSLESFKHPPTGWKEMSVKEMIEL